MRAAYPLRSYAYEKIITANDARILLKNDRRTWNFLRSMYEDLSKIQTFPFIGKYIWSVYDYFQRISPLYPLRDLSSPNFGVFIQHLLLKRGFQNSLIEFMKEKDLPVISTFFSTAIAAEYHGMKRIFCVVTDSDINRIWAPYNSKKTKIMYCTPTLKSYKRLIEYGVPEKQLFFTGFPLPDENIGPNLSILKKDFAERIAILDKINSLRKNTLVKKKTKRKRPLTITFAVGGAGAQKEYVDDILQSLHSLLLEKKIMLNLIAGTHPEVAEYFKGLIKKYKLEKLLGKEITVVQSVSYDAYFKEFNIVLRKTDILWTKPSEMSFYSALGIPLILTPSLGYHEYLNEQWLIRRGFGIKQEDPKYTAEWLHEWLEEGLFAKIAWNGYLEAPKYGKENILNLAFAKNPSKVKLKY